MVGLIDVKQKGGASVGYWVNYVTLTLTSPMTLTVDVSRSNFKIAASQDLLSDWCQPNRKQINQILSWVYALFLRPHPWLWTCSFKVKIWKSLIWGMVVCVCVLIEMEQKWCESFIHDHDRYIWVTMVGWVDVPYSDWGHFRRRQGVDISSFYFKLVQIN